MKNLELIANDLLDMGVNKKEDIEQYVKLTEEEMQKIIEIMKNK